MKSLLPYPLPLLIHTLSDLLRNISWTVSISVWRLISSWRRKSWRHTGSVSSRAWRKTRRKTWRHFLKLFSFALFKIFLFNFSPRPAGILKTWLKWFCDSKIATRGDREFTLQRKYAASHPIFLISQSRLLNVILKLKAWGENIAQSYSNRPLKRMSK